MERMWSDILKRFGQDVVLRDQRGDAAVRALVQPCLDRGKDQEVPGPLGLGQQGRFRYMGPASHPLGPDTVVEWKGQEYRVRSAHLIGEGVCPYWWATLYVREETVV